MRRSRGSKISLSTYRYQETAAPLIQVAEPVRVVERRPRRGFSFVFAFAGSVFVVVILIGVWLQFLNGQRRTEIGVVTTSQPLTVPQKVEPEYSGNTSEISVDKVDNTAVTAVPSRAIFRQRVRKRATRDLVAKRAATRIDLPATLTKDEKYAYGQLMLALSITGSKLKMVRDTINGED